jgi:prevent-host-death family protein
MTNKNTNIKAHTADVFKQIEEKNNPVVITQNGEAKAVLMNDLKGQ